MGNAIEAFILHRGEAGIRQISRFMDNIHLGGSGSGTGVIPIEWNSGDDSVSGDDDDDDSNWTDVSSSSDGTSDDEGVDGNRNDSFLVEELTLRLHDPLPDTTLHCAPLPHINIFLEHKKFVCNCLTFTATEECFYTNNFSFFLDADVSINFEELEIEAHEGLDDDYRPANNNMRKVLYSRVYRALDVGYTYMQSNEKGVKSKKGTYQKRERIRLPSCVEARIRQIYPSKNGMYMGFKES